MKKILNILLSITALFFLSCEGEHEVLETDYRTGLARFNIASINVENLQTAHVLGSDSSLDDKNKQVEGASYIVVRLKDKSNQTITEVFRGRMCIASDENGVFKPGICLNGKTYLTNDNNPIAVIESREDVHNEAGTKLYPFSSSFKNYEDFLNLKEKVLDFMNYDLEFFIEQEIEGKLINSIKGSMDIFNLPNFDEKTNFFKGRYYNFILDIHLKFD